MRWRLWIRRRATVTWALAALSALVVLLFLRTSAWEQQRIQRSFDERASRMVFAIKQSLIGHLDALESLHDFFSGSPEVERQAFASFAAGAIARRPGLVALGWNRRILAGERDSFEAAARRDGFAGFEIKELDPRRRLVRAGDRSEYAVVDYLEPSSGNEAVMGFDVASDPVHRQALSLSRDLDQSVATSRIHLVEDSTAQIAFLILRPVYATGLPHRTLDERRRNLRGYATGVVRVADLVEASLRDVAYEGIELGLFDVTGSQEDPLYTSPVSAPPPTAVSDGPGPSQLRLEATFAMAGRRWSVRAFPSPAYLAAQRSWAAWVVLAVGLLVTGLLGAFMLTITGRATKVEMLVAQRTADLAESNHAIRRLAWIVESSSDAIIGMTLDGRIVSWNAGAEQMYGYTPAEVQGRHVSLLHPPDGPEQILTIHAGVGLEHRPANVEMTNRTKDGRLIDVSLIVSPIRDAGGTIGGLSTIVRDITDRKALGRMKDEFVGTVSHELRTPLTAIKGFIELVGKGDAGEVNETQRGFLEIAALNADRLGALINDLLDVNRLEFDHVEMRNEKVDLTAVLEEVASTYRVGANAGGLELRGSFAGLPPVFGDRDRLVQVFNNLVSNAIKYTPAGEVEISARLSESEVEIEVRDTGIGLSPEERNRLFTKFFRSKSAVVRDPGGTGLGLVIAKAIVERHRGRIEVESAPGAGTLFRVVLPRPRVESADPPAAA